MRQIQVADLTASANEIDTRMGPVPGRSSDRIANELRWAAAEIERLSLATQEPSGWRWRLKGTQNWHYDVTIKNGADPRVIDPAVCEAEPFYLQAAWSPAEREAVARAIFGDGWKCFLNLGPYVQSTVKELADLRAAVAKTRTNLAGMSKSDDDIYAAMVRRLDGATANREDDDDQDVDPTGAELLKPRGNGGVVDAEVCFCALLLMGDVDISEERVAKWPASDLAIAYDWAMRRHLAASDNDDVIVPPRPAFIPVAKFGGF